MGYTFPRPRYPAASIRLTGEQRHMTYTVGDACNALRRAGAPEEEIVVFRDDALSDDGDHARRVLQNWLTVE